MTVISLYTIGAQLKNNIKKWALWVGGSEYISEQRILIKINKYQIVAIKIGLVKVSRL